MPQAQRVDFTRRLLPRGRAGFQTLRDNRRARQLHAQVLVRLLLRRPEPFVGQLNLNSEYFPNMEYEYYNLHFG